MRTAAALVAAAGLAACLAVGCAHVAPTAPDETAPVDARERYYAGHAPRRPVPRASLFFSSPLHLEDGARAEPHELLDAVDPASATARAVRRYDADRAAFYGLFAAGALLELASTASTIAGVPLLFHDVKTGTAVLVGGRVVEVAGFAALAAGYFLFGVPSIDARDEAFRSYDDDLRARLGLPALSEGGARE